MKYDKKTPCRTSWYEASTTRRAATSGPLAGSTTADVCIIGGGFTGVSAALELAQKDYRVIVLEAGTGMGGGASGKNGGHIIRGVEHSPAYLSSRIGQAATQTLYDMTLEGIDLIRARVKTYAIDCDLHTGHVTAAINPHHLHELEQEQRAWEAIGHGGVTMLDRRACENYVRGHGYIGGRYDSISGHFHPYAYLQGIAAAAQKHGAVLHDATRVTTIDTTGATPVVTTQGGAQVTARYVLVAGAIDIPPMRASLRKSISATAHMIATTPLDEAAARAILPANVAVADANYLMNYYRLSHDRRLLFGGSCNYSGRELGFEHIELSRRLAQVFPALAGIGIDHLWHGPLDLTANRLPTAGRLAPHVFYAHGFGGHGVVATNIMGKLMAEAIMGTAERFDIFTRIPHIPLVGGTLAKRPLFMLGMLWYQLRDALRA